jgi:capsular exopolysaccharide synthesis family protein
MEGTFSEQPLDLREYLAVIRARKVTIIVTLVFVIALALAATFRQTPLYRASARLLVKPISSDSFYIAPPNLETEAEVFASEPVAVVAQERLESDSSVGALLSGLDVEPITETEVLVVNYTSPDPEVASDVANAFAFAYIDYKQEQALRELQAAEDAVQKDIDRIRQRLSQTTTDLRQARRSGDRTLVQTLDGERGAQIARLGVMQQSLDDIQPERSVETGGGQVIEGASVPGSPFSPNYVRNASFGAFLGLLLGIGLAFLRDRLDDRFRSRKDLERALGAPVLATVPRFDRSKVGSLAVVDSPQGAASEAYRTLRTNVQFLAAQHGTKSILITSPSPGEGKTITCANLGVALAQAGLRVIVVSADLRRPMIEQVLAIPNDTGLSLWLIGREPDPWDHLERPGIANLRALPSGPIPPNPAELLASERFRSLADLLEENSDVVLYDSPPTLGLADSVNIAARAQGTILVVDAGATGRSHAIHAKEELERVGTRIIGTVLNSLDLQGSPTYYYSASYYTTAAPPPPVPPTATNGTSADYGEPGVEGVEAPTTKKKASPFTFRR